MPSSRLLTRRLRFDRAATLLVLLCLVGCATARAPPSRASTRTVLKPATDIEETIEPQTLPMIPVVREGRYTLVELAPEAGQEDLMQQIVEITIPATLTATVGDALRYVLYRSGFELCRSPDIGLLDRLPLPAADLDLGPLTLESTLRILAGPGWNLKVDEMTREVCFTPVSPLPARETAARTGRALKVGPEHGP